MHINTHTKTIIAVVGVCMGIVIGERSVFGTEVVVASLLLFVTQFLIHVLRRKKVSSPLYETEEENREEKSNSIRKRSSIALVTGIFFLSVCVGAVRMQFVSLPDAVVCDSPCLITAKITREPQSKDIYQILDLRPLQKDKEDIPESLLIRVRVPLYPQHSVGDVLTLLGKVSLPTTIYPHGNKKSFEYDEYLLLKNLGSEMQYPKVLAVESGTQKTFIEKLISFEHTLISTLDKNMSTPPSLLASGMVFGDRRMSQELTETFRVSGLSHIVVLSGFNIVILISALFFVTMFLPLFARVFVVVLGVLIFVMMTGAEASIVRATLMASTALIALLLGRGYIAGQALLISFLIIIMYTPQALLYDVSLHLSFLATAGIVYMSGGIKSLVEKVPLPPFFRKVGYQEIMTTTLCAYVMTLPYIMYTFGTASIYALLANVIVLPLVPCIMLMACLLIILSPVSTLLSSLVGYMVTLLGSFVIWVARFVEALPYASVSLALSLHGMALMYVFIFVVYIFVTKKKDETSITNDNEIISGIIRY